MKAHFLFFVFYITINTNVFAQITPTLNEIWIPMRDGDSLSADVYIPTGTVEGQVILVQTPYNKNMFQVDLPLGIGQNVNSQPYIWVIMDWRGFYGSSDADLSSVNRGEDGYDACEWISQQTWFADRIGTWGPSALGKIQYQTAREQHPNHTCAVPVVAHPHTSYDDYYTGGVLEKARLEQLDALGYGLSPFVLGNPYYNNVWQFAENNSWYPDDIVIPTLQIGGWYDHNIDKMLDWYEACRNLAEVSVRDEQWLLVGPWVHGGHGSATPGGSPQGELLYPNAANVNNAMALDFFDHYLLLEDNGWENNDMIRYYELGENVWRTTNNTRVDVTTYDELFLSNGNALSGSVGTSSTSFVSDPNNPSPTIGGATLSPDLDQGPYNQSALDLRSDLVTFTSDELLMDVNTIGNVQLNLFVEVNQPDADLSVRLVDVYPDGTNMLITDGIQRIRFRNGFTQADETFMTSGTVYEVDVNLAVTNYTWKAGHKIKVYIGGNNSTRWDVNLQNGGAMYVPGTANLATITIHHNSTYPSKISLPGSNPMLSLSEHAENGKLSVFPNPVDDVLTLKSDEEILGMKMYDVSGKEVLIDAQAKGKVNVSELNAGIYFISVETSKGNFVKEVVVK